VNGGRVAVVGAGVGGLTSAYRLVQAGCAVTVFESEPKAGGRVETFRGEGYVVDTAATAVGGGYEAYRSLAAELGVPIVPSPACTGIVRDGRIHLLRLDRMIRSGVATRLLSTSSKLLAARLGFDVMRAKAKGLLDYSDMRKAAPLDTESAHEYASRALNAELDSYLCEPITRAMLIADTSRASKVELFSGVANAFGGGWGALEGGAVGIVDALAERVGGVRVSCPVREVRPTGSGVEVTYRDENGAQTSASFDACVVACPLPAAVAICPDHGDLLGPLNDGLPFTSAISVAVGTTRQPECPALMLQLPAREERDIALIFLDHNKTAGRAPDGHGLFTTCWEIDASARRFDEPDDALVAHAVAVLTRYFPELDGTVDFTHVRRWALALPHTKTGTFAKISAFNAALDPADPIQFVGDYMSEAGQNSAMAVGNRAAANIVAHHPAVTSAF
jgi:oxygen-dependent protoporphyrinogen oxidase